MFELFESLNMLSQFLSLYIDPGTGSMLFTIAIGVASVFVFLSRSLMLKIKFILSRGKADNLSKSKLDYVIFSDDKRYWTTFEPICDEFEKRETEVYYYTASEDDPALNRKDYKYVHAEFIGSGNKAFSKMNLINADIVLSTTPSLDVFQWKRSRTAKYYVHIFHACADPASYRMFGLDYYDSLLLPGPCFRSQIRELEELRNLPQKELVDIGLPYLDRIYDRVLREGDSSESNKTPVVLLAPSWGANGILSRYGSSMIDALISTGYHIIIRPHPQSFTAEKDLMDMLMNEYPDSDKLEWNRDNDNFDVLNRSDVLISDFSGVVYDYALTFNKPVIYSDFKFDPSEYDAYWLKDEMWLFKTLRKIGHPIGEDYKSQIKNLIDNSINSKASREAISEAAKEGWSNIGESAVRTVDYLIDKHNSLNK